MIFETLFLVGLIGFLAMVGMGMMHGHDHGGSHAGHDSHDASHSHHIGTHGSHHSAHPDHASAHGHAHGHGHDEPQQGMRLPFFMSPLNIFSTCLGMGAVGLLIQGRLGFPIAFAAALLAGILFTAVLIKPIFGFLLNFSSTPSEGLEGTVAQTAEAVGAFDADGRGLIRMTLDGELVQLLARLEAAEIHQGTSVKRGDTVVITSIDPGKGTCTVTRELSD